MSTAFVHRHIGPRPADIEKMLSDVGSQTLDDLTDQIVPAGIRDDELDLPEALSEPRSPRGVEVDR